MLIASALSLVMGTTVLAAAAASETATPPPDAPITDQSVRTWLDRHIRAEGWTVIAADHVAVALGSPDGVIRTSDGMLRAEIRHEYYKPTQLDPMSSRSNLQSWEVDCKARRVRVLAMQIFTLNNVQGESLKRENPQAPWTTASPGSVKDRTIDRICRSPTEGKPLPLK